MAVPSSGQLLLRGDIGQEVYSNATGSNISLGVMSDFAGFASPDAMSDFYGYSNIVPPSVTTNNPSSVASTSMTLNGNVTSTGFAPTVTRGFYFGTSAPSAPTNTKYTVGSGGTGAYSNGRPGLSYGTTYYNWAFASNDAGESLGNRCQATTPFPTFTPTYITAARVRFYTETRISSTNKCYQHQYLNPFTSGWVTFSSNSGTQSTFDWNLYDYNGAKHASNTKNRMQNTLSGAPGVFCSVNSPFTCKGIYSATYSNSSVSSIQGTYNCFIYPSAGYIQGYMYYACSPGADAINVMDLCYTSDIRLKTNINYL